MDKPLRTSVGPIALLRTALGGPRQVVGKARRLVETIRLYVDRKEIPNRLAELERSGMIDQAPTRLQLIFGGIDMLRFLIAPGARDYYTMHGVSFGFHQVLRVLDDPVSMVDPTGFLSARDTIVGHLMQVVHLNPIYDLQLLTMFSTGLEELEGQLEEMIAGCHPRSQTIGAIVLDPSYHQRLLDYVRRYRADPYTEQMARVQTLRGDRHFAAAEASFATLPGFLAYCCGLPEDFIALVRRFFTVRQFPIDGDL